MATGPGSMSSKLQFRTICHMKSHPWTFGPPAHGYCGGCVGGIVGKMCFILILTYLMNTYCGLVILYSNPGFASVVWTFDWTG